MSASSARENIQRKLDAVTRRWWVYPLLLAPFFIPSYASEGYDPRETTDLMMDALSNSLIYSFSILMPVAKAIPVVLVVGVMVFGNRMRRAFNGYAALLHLALAFLQATALTDRYGLVVLFGNLALILVVALFWTWEFIAGRNDFEPRKRPPWKWWVVPLAVLALLAPVDTSSLSPGFSPALLFANESGLTYCMMTPVFLAVLTLFHPGVNLAVLRVSSFVGIIFGLVNLIVWFAVRPSGWWMGVMHVPLLLISVYAFVLAHLRAEARAGEERTHGVGGA